jgi:hypothetical protein
MSALKKSRALSSEMSVTEEKKVRKCRDNVKILSFHQSFNFDSMEWQCFGINSLCDGEASGWTMA